MNRLLELALVGFALVGCTGNAATTPPLKPAEPVAVDSAVPAAPNDWRQDAKVPVSSDDPALGPKNAPVTIVMFGDCPCPSVAM